MHQNRVLSFASDFHRRRGYRRELCSEDHFYQFSSQKKSRFASGFLRRGNRASWGLNKSRDFSGSGKNRRRNRRESRDFVALRLCIKTQPLKRPRKRRTELCLAKGNSLAELPRQHSFSSTPTNFRSTLPNTFPSYISWVLPVFLFCSRQLRGPVAILFISRDVCSDSIAKFFRVCFCGGIAHLSRDTLQNGVSHRCASVKLSTKGGYRTILGEC